jgi:hypothetical protein
MEHIDIYCIKECKPVDTDSNVMFTTFENKKGKDITNFVNKNIIFDIRKIPNNFIVGKNKYHIHIQKGEMFPIIRQFLKNKKVKNKYGFLKNPNQ